MKKMLIAIVFTCVFICQLPSAKADCQHDLCGRWEGEVTVANNDDPAVPFIEVAMVIEISAVEGGSKIGRLFVGTVEFLGMPGPPTPFDLTGILFGHMIKASTAGTVLSALLSWDGTRMSGYYLDTLMVPNTRSHPQTGKFDLVKETQ